MKRQVMVSRNKILPTGKLKPQEMGVATFHEFGQDHQEYEGGPGNYPVAIVEWPDGRVESVYVDMIRFLEPNEANSDK